MKKMPKLKNKDPHVSFIYYLLRDHLPAGTVLQILHLVEDDRKHDPEWDIFSNGWLAQYAEFIVDRLEERRR